MEQQIEIGMLDGQNMALRTIHPYGCVLLRCDDGCARLSINHKPYILQRGELCVLTSDFFMSVQRVSRHFSAHYLSLPEAVFNSVYYQVSNMSLWEFLMQHPILRLSAAQWLAFDGWQSVVDWAVLNTSESVRHEIVTALSCSLFRAIDDQLETLYGKTMPIAKNSSWNITVKFFTLLYKHYREHRSVEFYADQMNISADYLNKAIRRVYGIAPKKFINEQLTEEIKFRLTHTEQSVKEIAQSLHFDDTSYFCRFFRKQTHLSPMDFRNKQ